MREKERERKKENHKRERGVILVPRRIVYVALNFPTMHLTNGVTLKFNRKTILQNLCKNRDYFIHFKKIRTNVQNGYKDRDQNVYSFSKIGMQRHHSQDKHPNNIDTAA